MYLIRNTNLNYTVLFELPSKIVIKKIFISRIIVPCTRSFIHLNDDENKRLQKNVLSVNSYFPGSDHWWILTVSLFCGKEQRKIQTSFWSGVFHRHSLDCAVLLFFEIKPYFLSDGGYRPLFLTTCESTICVLVSP